MVGDELYNYLLRHGAIPVERVQSIFTQLVGAVAYVHSLSCVHRDLKLENILLDKNENVKLCDFGFTREYEGKSSYLQTFCGTVCYSAPEMLKGEKYAGEKVDVWSLGIILYALLTGELPFDDDEDMITKHKILSSEPNFPDTFPQDAKSLVSQLLSKRPLLRPGIADILTNPFLSEHAPQQQAILKLAQPLPFTTDLEKETLERMRSAGVDVDKVIENVLAQRCDALAGWWALLIEKEGRKEKRRERKRREREMEAKNIRRLSATSSRLERIAAPLREVDEEGLPSSPSADVSRSRGRRSTPTRKSSEQINDWIVLKRIKLNWFFRSFLCCLKGALSIRLDLLFPLRQSRKTRYVRVQRAPHGVDHHLLPKKGGDLGQAAHSKWSLRILTFWHHQTECQRDVPIVGANTPSSISWHPLSIGSWNLPREPNPPFQGAILRRSRTLHKRKRARSNPAIR